MSGGRRIWIHADGGVIDHIADYYACPWILDMASADAG